MTMFKNTYNLAKENMERFGAKVNKTKADVDFINSYLAKLRSKDVKVDLIHQTGVMQKYKITYGSGNGKVHQDIIEYAGALVKFLDDSNLNKQFYADGLVGQMLKYLHKKLQKCVEPRTSLMTRVTDKLKGRQY